jgi:hypothetical protein
VIPKKKGNGKKKQTGAKGFTSMVVKDMRKMLRENDASSGDGEGDAEREEDTLFKLVRNENEKGKKKRRVNFIVTLVEGEKDYVPSRWSSLMVNDKGDGEKFVLQRPS